MLGGGGTEHPPLPSLRFRNGAWMQLPPSNTDGVSYHCVEEVLLG